MVVLTSGDPMMVAAPATPPSYRRAGTMRAPTTTPLARLIGLRAREAQRRGGGDYLLTPARAGRVNASRCTYVRLAHDQRDWEETLVAHGVPRGAVVGLALSDPIELAVAFLSIMAADRWVAPVDPSAPPTAMEATWQALGPAAVIGGASSPRTSAPGPGVPDGKVGGRFPVALRPPHRPSGNAPVDRPVAPGHAGVILSSSGTTGTPKVVALDQGRLLHTAGAIAEHHRLVPGDRGLSPLPLFHVNAEVVGLLATLCAGSSLVLEDRFHRRRFWSVVDDLEVTWVNAVPAIITRLCQPDPDGATDRPVPERVRFVRSASAPLPRATRARFEALTGVAVLETYGMTEAASQICANDLDGPRKPGSVGRPVGHELRIRRPDGSACQPGETGAVEIKGPGVIDAYVSVEHNTRFGPHGWLDTGDLGRVDEDGDLFLVGRSDDVINRGGEKMLPRRVEEVVAECPDVSSVAVVGEPDPILGHVPVAYVVARSPGPEEPERWAMSVLESARARCRDRLARPEQPVRYVALDALPAGPTGKVQRRALHNGAAAAIATLEDR